MTPEQKQITPLSLGSEHIRDARLFAHRDDLIRSLSSKKMSKIAEIGVALGDFSQFLLRELNPVVFIAIDTFVVHKFDELWGKPTSEIFQGKTHLEYYEDKMAAYKNVIIEPGLSHKRLSLHSNKTFDLIYVDADHAYEQVRLDAFEAERTIKDDGIIVFNDYIIGTPFHGEYGVVPVVNELVVNRGFKIIGFALHQWMYCDIAIAR